MVEPLLSPEEEIVGHAEAVDGIVGAAELRVLKRSMVAQILL